METLLKASTLSVEKCRLEGDAVIGENAGGDRDDHGPCPDFPWLVSTLTPDPFQSILRTLVSSVTGMSPR